MTVTVNLKLRALANTKIDLTKEMLTAADIVAQEMRGNVKEGLDVHGNSLTPNKPGYANWKRKTLGHSRPLIAKERRLVTPSAYRIQRRGINFVSISLPGAHPGTSLSVGQLGYIHNFGLGKNPVREFAGITATARKRVVAFLRDTIARLFKRG